LDKEYEALLAEGEELKMGCEDRDASDCYSNNSSTVPPVFDAQWFLDIEAQVTARVENIESDFNELMSRPKPEVRIQAPVDLNEQARKRTIEDELLNQGRIQRNQANDIIAAFEARMKSRAQDLGRGVEESKENQLSAPRLFGFYSNLNNAVSSDDFEEEQKFLMQ
jgi:hypothetical protein